jgi:hypothetical protein
MLLSVILLNIKDSHSYAKESLYTIEQQLAVDWGTDVELLIVNKSKPLNLNNFPILKSVANQITLSESVELKNIIDECKGDYFTLLGLNEGFMSMIAVNTICKNIMNSPVDCVSYQTLYLTEQNECYSSPVGFVINKEWAKKTSPAICPFPTDDIMYWTQLCLQANVENIMRYDDTLFISYDSSMETEISASESVMLCVASSIHRSKKLAETYYNELAKTCYDAWYLTKDMPIRDSARIRIKLSAALKSLQDISVKNLSNMQVDIPGNEDEGDINEFQTYMNKIMEGLK